MCKQKLFLKSLVFLQEFNPLTSSSLAGPFIPHFYLLEFARERGEVVVGGWEGGKTSTAAAAAAISLVCDE